MTYAVRKASAIYDAAPPVSGGKALSNRAARSGTTVHGWPAVFLGVPIAAAGFGLAALVLGLIAPGKVRTGGMPPWILAMIGVSFAWAGLSSSVHGIFGLRRMARERRLRANHPGEPWRWDHPWNERGTHDDTLARARLFFNIAVFVFVFLTPFHWIGFFAPRRALPFGIVALLFDAIAVGLLVAAGYFVLRRLKYGRGMALFGQFPFRRGSTLELHVEAPRALPQHAVATATVRCVQERYVTSGTGEDRNLTVHCFEVFRDTVPAELVSTSIGRALRVRFAIPSDVPTTDLASRPCRYWEVDVEAITDGVDYAARFLVPVY